MTPLVNKILVYRIVSFDSMPSNEVEDLLYYNYVHRLFLFLSYCTTHECLAAHGSESVYCCSLCPFYQALHVRERAYAYFLLTQNHKGASQ
jgi:hypothetical protein